jgi:hypothetical protein
MYSGFAHMSILRSFADSLLFDSRICWLLGECVA